ncbi:hypothetical protein LOD99_16129 [Oopsacas minuta]|uniref:MACPF domain-containing protein n=1 Tax=Oopsacas minuta TaxID=111878 RepID=A0AAV7K6E3_9METZ|nr:hypothetical protein LOD99_16129 [Oopsacas minuta]
MAERGQLPRQGESEIPQKPERPGFKHRYLSLPHNPAESFRISQRGRHRAMGMVEKSLLAQRPANRAVIFLYGLSGSGKTSTLKHLFRGAEELMATSYRESTTDNVIEYITSLKSDHWGAQNLEISWVDSPGFADTQGKHKDAENLSLIEEFISQHPQLGMRHLKWFGMNYNYIVFPNIFLIVVDVNDERMLGSISRIASMFSVVKRKRLHLVDRKHPNVVIVLTHVCSLPPKVWKTKLDSKACYIKLLARRFFKIEVPVIYIENDYVDYDLEKVGDFSILYNGEEQPNNLFKACIDLMRGSQDEIGIEAIRLFFSTTSDKSLDIIRPNIVSCSSITDQAAFDERKKYFYEKITILKGPFKPTIVSSKIDEYIKISSKYPENIGLKLEDELYPLKFLLDKRGIKKVEDLESRSLDDIEILLIPYKLNQIEIRTLSSLFNIKPPVIHNISTKLGHGYDLMKQTVSDKAVISFPPDISLHPYGFLIPGNCQCEYINDINFICNHYSDLAEYTKDFLKGCDLENYEKIFQLTPTPGYNIIEQGSKKKTVQVSFVFEKINLSIKSNNLAYNFTQGFQDALEDIPESYDESNTTHVQYFTKLFAKYGGCVVTKVSVGGYIQGKFEVSIDKLRDSGYFQYLRQWFLTLVMDIKSGLSIADKLARTVDVEKEFKSPLMDLLHAELEWFGGDPRHYQPTLIDISTGQWLAWEKSTNYYPSILPLQIIYKPIFHIVQEGKNVALQEAFEKICLKVPPVRKQSRILRLFSGKMSYTRAEASEKAKSEIPDGKTICFPASSKVLLSTGRIVCMRDLQIGDKILSVDSQGRSCFSSLYLWGHLDPARKTEYLCIRYKEGELKVSENHLVFVEKEGIGEPIPAGRVCPGDMLQFVCVAATDVVSSVEVLSVSYVRDEGVYSPFTLNSCIVVDGILCSVFAVPETTVGDTRKAHERGHRIMFPMRNAYKSGMCSWLVYQMDAKKKMHFYCSALEKMYYAFRPVEKLYQK